MSEQKPKPPKAKEPKKLFDVAHPGRSAATPTSRPVIVTNRQVLKDPMVADTPSSAPEVPSSAPKLSGSAKKIHIRPLSDEVTPEDTTPETLGVTETSEAKIESATAPELPAEVKEPDEDKAPVPDDASAEDLVPEPAETGATPDEAVAPEDVSEDAPKDEPTAEFDEPAEPEPTTPTKTEDDAKPSSESKPAVATDKQKSAAAEAEAAAAKEEAEHREATQKLIDERKYFLPINSIQKRRTKRHVFLGTLLIIILIAAWVDIALDAGLIHINGLDALTHFFDTP